MFLYTHAIFLILVSLNNCILKKKIIETNWLYRFCVLLKIRLTELLLEIDNIGKLTDLIELFNYFTKDET